MCTGNVTESILLDIAMCKMLWVNIKQFSQTTVKMNHGNEVKTKGSLKCDTIKWWWSD